MGSKLKTRKGLSNNNYLGILIALIALCIVLSITSNSFLTTANLLNISQQISTNFLIAMGMTFVILIGGIDLSVGSIAAFTGLVLAMFLKNMGMPLGAGLIITLIIAIAIGVVTGLLITLFDLPPFIATLGTMSIVRGAAYVVTGGQPIYNLPESLYVITNRYYGIPIVSLLIMIVICVLSAFILKYTKLGRYIYAIGGNEKCAVLSGINVKRVKCFVYGFSGFCCGVAAIVLTSRLQSAVPTNADGAELDAIASVVIGGASMNGGEGTILGTVIGALIIGVVSNGMNLLNVSQGSQKMVKGAIIVLAVIVDQLRRRKAAKA